MNLIVLLLVLVRATWCTSSIPEDMWFCLRLWKIKTSSSYMMIYKNQTKFLFKQILLHLTKLEIHCMTLRMGHFDTSSILLFKLDFEKNQGVIFKDIYISI